MSPSSGSLSGISSLGTARLLHHGDDVGLAEHVLAPVEGGDDDELILRVEEQRLQLHVVSDGDGFGVIGHHRDLDLACHQMIVTSSSVSSRTLPLSSSAR